MKTLPWIASAVALLLGPATPATVQAEEAIRLLIRSDDIGSCHGANVACIESYTDGIARSVELMVPCPWFNEAVVMLQETPGLDVGVHLTLTAEWENVKWGPLTHAPSLVDERGHFFPATRQKEAYPPNTGFLDAGPRIEEVEQELRAQIELALEHVPNVTHLSTHMGTPHATPELKALVKRLAEQYGLPVEIPGIRRMPHYPRDGSLDEKIDGMVEILENLEPGVWLFVEHPGTDTPEMRAMGHIGSPAEGVGPDREAVTRIFTSEKVKQAVRRQGIELVSYGDLIREAK